MQARRIYSIYEIPLMNFHQRDSSALQRSFAAMDDLYGKDMQCDKLKFSGESPQTLHTIVSAVVISLTRPVSAVHR